MSANEVDASKSLKIMYKRMREQFLDKNIILALTKSKITLLVLLTKNILKHSTKIAKETIFVNISILQIVQICFEIIL